jgi:CDP-glucose 4,6-dehydratase
MKILITGHTGFKGSWFTLMLSLLGHEVSGIAKPPESQNLFEVANIRKFLKHNYYLDINYHLELKNYLKQIKPEVIIHMAAQPLVMESINNPRETYETNVMGTFNILEASEIIDTTNILVITSDKVYSNRESERFFLETDQLGGGDPYSNSKAMSDLLAQHWHSYKSNLNLGVLRAGNVIGGGDFAKNRLLPDIVKSIYTDEPLVIRNLNAIRPWQHIFDCLDGYVKALEFIQKGQSGVWNIGPEPKDFRTVKELINLVSERTPINYVLTEQSKTNHERNTLLLSNSKAKNQLNWKPKLGISDAINISLDWYSTYYENSSKIEEFSMQQLNNYLGS